MRGRKPDAKGSQAAKGHPGKRRKQKEPRLSAEDRAAQLAAVEAQAESASHPKFLAHPKLKEALSIWRELEPDLARLHLLERLDRHAFAMYCVHMADWIAATRDIQKRGQWRNVRNVNGDLMPRLNPMVKVREIAERHILDIGSRFGLDPANRYKLLRDQAAAPAPSGGLFDRPQSQQGEGQAQPQATPVSQAELPSALGLMGEMSSPVPGSRPN